MESGQSVTVEPNSSMTHMDAESFNEFVSSSEFQFAKTMADIPHEYTLRKKAASDERFADAVQFIRDNGFRRRFSSRFYTYYRLGGYVYWTMGAPVDETILINRAVEERDGPGVERAQGHLRQRW